MTKKHLLVFLLLIPAYIFAQKTDSIQTFSSKDSYIETFDNYLTARLSLFNNTQSFKINSAPTHLLLKPNSTLQNVIYLDYRFISIFVFLKPKFLPGNNDDSEKGKSKVQLYGMTLNFDHWAQSVSFNQIKGFYLANSDEVQYTPNQTEFLTFPDLKLLGFYGHTGYKFNPNFSFNSIEIQSERQLKSAGTFMPILSYKYYIIDNQIELTGTRSSQKSNNLEANLQLGYFYTQVIDKTFYVSGGVAAGGGIIHSKLLTRYTNQQVATKSDHPIFRMEGMIGLGYNSERFFAGGQILASMEKYPQNKNSSTIVNEAVTFQVFIGYRFNAPKFLIKAFDKMQF